MRIGIDARELQGRPTGAGRYLRNLLRQWAPGDDALFLYFNGPPPDDHVVAGAGVRPRGVGDGSASGLVWQERSLPAAAERDGIEVFFAPAYSCPLRLRLPRVTALHDLSFFALPAEFSPLEGAKRRLLAAASVRASARLLACSEFTRREIAARFPEAAARVLHVPLGPDDDLAPAPARADAMRRLAATGPTVLSVGTLFHRRCVPELLRAAAILARRWPRLRLEIVGENRSHPWRDFEALASELGVAQRVRFAGFVDEAGLADRYAAADVAVALSVYEGFGLPALEALARGVPLVAAARPSLDEVVGDAALLVDPRDPPAIAAALARVLADPGLAARMADAGRARAARYSWARAARATRDALLAAVA